jgi:hypothetical protein
MWNDSAVFMYENNGMANRSIDYMGPWTVSMSEEVVEKLLE